MEQKAQGPWIVKAALFEGQKDVTQQHNGRMGDERVEVSGLAARFQLQELLGGPEEDFDVPALAVDADHIFVGQGDVSAKQGQPVLFPTVPDEDNPSGLAVVHGDHSAGQDFGPSPALLEFAVDSFKGKAFPLESIEDFWRSLDHADDRNQGTQDRNDGRHAEPTVHEQVTSLDPGLKSAAHHGRKKGRGFDHGFPATLGPARAPVQVLGDALVAVAGVGGRQKGEVQGNQAGAVRPCQVQHPEPLEETILAVVIEPGQEFDLLGLGAMDGSVVQDEHGFTVFAGEGVEHARGLEGHREEQPSPAEAR